MNDAKSIYRAFCGTPAAGTLPLFSSDWWLDAVVGPDRWDVAVVTDGEGIVASMPYTLRRRRGFTVSNQPALTPSLGPWLRPSAALKESTRLGYEKKLMGELVERLPRVDYFLQKWHWSRTNWLPFHWAGYRQTTRYTYRLPDISDPDAVWKGMDQNIRAEIRKARDRAGLAVREGTVNEFLPLNRMTFSRQGMRLPYSEALVRSIDTACGARDCRRIWLAEDAQGRRHAAVFIVWDATSAYYLMGGGDPALRSSGATSLCMWEAIRSTAGATKAFDFEGSMIEPVERFFRAFGALQTPYTQVKKIDSAMLRVVDALRGGA